LLIKLKQTFAVSDYSEFTFFPVPRFTAPQAELYEAVLEIQRACLTLCSPGTSLENIHSVMLALLGQKLKELGIMKNSKENAFKVLYSLDPSSQEHLTRCSVFCLYNKIN
jgi:hypothetical protein